MKVGDKVRGKEQLLYCKNGEDFDVFTKDYHRFIEYIEEDYISLQGDSGDIWFKQSDFELVDSASQTDEHYNNENGSLYLFAKHHNLNAWEFDILKRVVRCRKKGQFKEDLEKTKRVIDLYLKEFEA